MLVLTKNKYYIISCGIILFAFILKIITCGIDTFNKFNVYDNYIRLVVKGGVYTAITVIIASILPSLSYCPPKSFSKHNKSLLKFSTRYYPKAFKVGIIFVVANLLALFICYIFSSKSAVYTGLGYGNFGTFGSIRMSIPLIYILIYIVNCFFFGFCMSVFSQSAVDLVEKKYTAILISIIYYYSYMFLPFSLISTPYFTYLVFLFPGFSYDFMTYDISVGQRLLGYIIILIISYFIYYFSYNRYLKSLELKAPRANFE